MPVVCNDRCRLVDDMAQFIDNYGRPCDHAETVATGGHFRSEQRRVLDCGFSSFFVLLWVVPELSASFSSPRR